MLINGEGVEPLSTIVHRDKVILVIFPSLIENERDSLFFTHVALVSVKDVNALLILIIENTPRKTKKLIPTQGYFGHFSFFNRRWKGYLVFLLYLWVVTLISAKDVNTLVLIIINIPRKTKRTYTVIPKQGYFGHFIFLCFSLTGYNDMNLILYIYRHILWEELWLKS